MYDGTMTYNYPVLEQGVENMRSVNRTILALVDQLRGETATALGSWEGEAASSYAQRAANIQANIADMGVIVDQLQMEVQRSAEAMRDQDRAGGQALAG